MTQRGDEQRDEMLDAMEECIANCQECHDICLQTTMYAVDKGGETARPEIVGILMDCTEICRTSADFMLRGSPYHGFTCFVCSVICEQCAEACEQFPDDPQMAACAEVCRECAASCRQMADSMGIQAEAMERSDGEAAGEAMREVSKGIARSHPPHTH
jgi:hypothetical protein